MLNKTMKTPQKLGLAALGLFTLSHCLPAYRSGGLGFSCFRTCCEIFLQRGEDLGGWLYYSGFAFSNLLFPILVVGLFLTQKRRQLRGLGSFILLLHVASWLVINLIHGEGSDIKIGYYVWLLAYALLFAAHLVRESNETIESTSGTAEVPVC